MVRRLRSVVVSTLAQLLAAAGVCAVPVLNIADFGCFLNKLAAGDADANCDESTSMPVLTIQDFGCFLNLFAAGCT